MGDLNLSQYQSAVRGALDELQSDHPRIVAGDHTRCINDAANDLILWFPAHFPEHYQNTWSIGPTVVGDHLMALPSNLNVLQKVRHSNGATITSGNWSSVQEEIVSQAMGDDIGLLDKDSDVDGYPSLYDRQGTSLLYWPTTRTGYTTTFRLYGIAGEVPLSAAGDTFRLDRRYDQAVVLLAASKLATIIGWTERAMELEAAARRIVQSGPRIVDDEESMMCIAPVWNFGGID